MQGLGGDHVTEAERISVISHGRAVRCTLKDRGRMAAIYQLDSRGHKRLLRDDVSERLIALRSSLMSQKIT